LRFEKEAGALGEILPIAQVFIENARAVAKLSAKAKAKTGSDRGAF